MMELVKMLAETAVEEAEGAHKYAKLAVQNKHEYPAMADAVANMALQELAHGDTLMKSAQTILDSNKPQTTEENAEHDALKYIFDYLKEKQLDEATATKVCLEKYRTM